MKRNDIITALENTVVPANCIGWPPAIDYARKNLIAALKGNVLQIDYEDHKAVSIPGPCVCVRTLVELAGLSTALLVHTGIYSTTVSFFWRGNMEGNS